MRNFNHIVLDLELKKNQASSANWLSKLASNINTNALVANVNTAKKLTLDIYKLTSNFEDMNATNIKDASTASATASLSLKGANTHNFSTNEIVNVNFLRKERLYTKLKYSRSPAYDIVSGGAAALLAGFIGFLISEKFGFELVDSGDFYYLFIYIVFASFSIRPLLTTMNYQSSIAQIFSLKEVIKFFTLLALMLLKKIKM